MSAPIGTSREIKNKETGLDISVPEYRLVSGLLTSYEEYQIIVITNLPYFKTIRNKQDDAVQFMVEKKYGDFEVLHKALTERFPATIFPDLPRKVLMVKDSTPQERRQSFDNLMKFIASSTKVCCSSLVLTFLGVKPDRIQQVEGGGDDVGQKDQENVEPPKLGKRRSKLLSSGSQQSSLFSDDAEDEFDFFQGTSNGVDTNQEDLEDDLFSEDSQRTSGETPKKGTDVLLFSDNVDDMTLSDNAAGIYLPPGATEEGATQATRFSSSTDDDKDLLTIEDDLDQLLSDVIKKPDKPPQKPSPIPKPSPTAKPALPSKPTPAPRPTPAARSATPGKTPPKPAPRKSKSSVSKDDSQQQDTKEDAKNITTMDDGDILKYIQENAPDEEASLDLF